MLLYERTWTPPSESHGSSPEARLELQGKLPSPQHMLITLEKLSPKAMQLTQKDLHHEEREGNNRHCP